MIDEEKTGQTQETTEQNYIEALEQLRNNTVPKEDYQKVLAENKQLLEAIVNGQKIEVEEEPKIDVDALRSDLFNKEMTNLEYAEKTLKLREGLLKRGERDPFLPNGKTYVANEFDIIEAEKAAGALQHCIDVAQGDPSIFQNELQRILVDRVPVKKNNNRR